VREPHKNNQHKGKKQKPGMQTLDKKELSEMSAVIANERST
jgi:hypothetical protein